MVHTVWTVLHGSYNYVSSSLSCAINFSASLSPILIFLSFNFTIFSLWLWSSESELHWSSKIWKFSKKIRNFVWKKNRLVIKSDEIRWCWFFNEMNSFNRCFDILIFMKSHFVLVQEIESALHSLFECFLRGPSMHRSIDIVFAFLEFLVVFLDNGHVRFCYFRDLVPFV